MIRRLRVWHVAVLAVVVLATAVTVTVVIQSHRPGMSDANLAKLDRLRIAGTLTPAVATELLGLPASAYPYDAIDEPYTLGGTRMKWESRVREQGMICIRTITIDFDGDGRCYTCGAGYREFHEDIWTKIGTWLGIW